MTVIEVTEPAQALRRTLAVDGRLVHRRGGRDLRHPRPERRRQDHHRRVRRRPAHARTRGRSACSASTRAATAPSCAGSSASSCRRAAAGEDDASREALELYASFYPTPADWRRAGRRARPRRQARTPRTRSCPAARSSACRSPWRWSATREIAILDELTTGLDPQARRDTWELIEDDPRPRRDRLLVTHFMEEAERLCDRLAVIDAGRVVAAGHAGRAGRRRRRRSSGSASGRRAPFDDACSRPARGARAAPARRRRSR